MFYKSVVFCSGKVLGPVEPLIHSGIAWCGLDCRVHQATNKGPHKQPPGRLGVTQVFVTLAMPDGNVFITTLLINNLPPSMSSYVKQQDLCPS